MIFTNHWQSIKGTPEVKNQFFDEFIFLFEYETTHLGNIRLKFYGNSIHRSRLDSLYTHTNLQGSAYTSSDNLLLLETSFFTNGIPYKSYNFKGRTMFFLIASESLTLEMLWIAFCDSEILSEICVDV